MNQLPKNKQRSSQQNIILIVGILMGIGIVVLATLVFLLFRQSGFQFPARATQMPIIPTMFFSTPECGSPTLLLGSTTFQIQTIEPAPDNSLAVPSDTSAIAYWVEGTSTNYVFGLSPIPSNLTLGTSLRKGDLVSIRWADCRLEEYIVKSIENGSLDALVLTNQSVAGATIFVQTGSTTEGIVIRSGRPEAQVVDTPNPEQSEIEAEISFLDTTVSPDGITIRMGISILNNGTKAFTLSTSDISLTPENADPLAPLSVEPALPREIQPGATETFYITFPRPTTNTGLFRILIFSIDIQVP